METATITKRSHDLTFLKKEVVTRIGYLNLNKGLKHLHQITSTSSVTEHRYAMVVKALEIEGCSLMSAITVTQQQEQVKKKSGKGNFSDHTSWPCVKRCTPFQDA